MDDAKKALAELPLSAARLLDFDVIPLGPFVNWEVLFAMDHK